MTSALAVIMGIGSSHLCDGGFSMGKRIFTKYLSGLCIVLLMVISLTTDPVSAKNVSNRDEGDKATARISRHMEKMQEKSPQIAEKKKEVEEKLKSGAITPKKACSHCHVSGQGAP